MARTTRQEVQRRIKMMITEQENFQNQLAVINGMAENRSDPINEYSPVLIQGSQILIDTTKELYSKF